MTRSNRPKCIQNDAQFGDGRPAATGLGNANAPADQSQTPRRHRDEPLGGFLFQWQWWLGYVVFTMLAVHLPWDWLATIADFDAFISFVAMFVPAVGLQPEGAYQQSAEASQLQLAFVHAVCIVAVTMKLIRQRPGHEYHPRLPQLRWYRLFAAIFLFGISLSIMLLTIRSMDGRAEIVEIPDAYYYANQYQFVFYNSFISWFPTLVIMSFMKLAMQELKRRSRIPIPWEQGEP